MRSGESVRSEEVLDLVVGRLRDRHREPRTNDGVTWHALCPAHDDHHPSLTVKAGSTQPVVLKCGRGCATEAVVDALGLTMRDICMPSPGDPPEFWIYVDEAGAPRFRVEKYPGKRFAQSRPDGEGGWTAGTRGVDRVLYRLAEVQQAVLDGQTIWIAEGEKDADRLADEGVVATTNSMGASKWRDEYSDVLASATVVIVSDRDDAGYRHALKVYDSVRRVDASVTIVEPAEGNDASDHFDAAHTLDDFVELRVEDLEKHLTELSRRDAQGQLSLVPSTSSWTVVDLQPVLNGSVSTDPPSILAMDDASALLYPSKVHTLNGEPESGKTWLALFACAQQLLAGRVVVYVDFEDTEVSAVERLLALAIPKISIRDQFLYLRPDEAITDRSRAALIDELSTRDVSLIVLDGMTEGLGLHGLSLLSNDDVAEYHRVLSRPLLDATHASILHIDHVGKDKGSRGRYAIGAGHKLAGVDVALTLEPISDFGRGQCGASKLVIAKDRPGHLRARAINKVLGIVSIEPRSTGSNGSPEQIEITIYPAGSAAAPGPAVTTTTDLGMVRQQIREYLERVRAASQRRILIDVPGGSEKIKSALQEMVHDGTIARTKRTGKGGGSEYQLIAEADEPNSPPTADEAA